MTISVVFRHLGPGPHPSGSPQSVHGKLILGVHEDAPVYTEPVKSKPLEIAEPNATNKQFAKMDAQFKEISPNTYDWHPEAARTLYEEFGAPPEFVSHSKEEKAYDQKWQPIYDYQSKLYQKINAMLREGKDNSKLMRIVTGVDALISHPLSRDMVLFRGVGTVHSGIDKLQAGDEWTERAYTSTTVSRLIGERFVSKSAMYYQRSKPGVLCRIVVPKGTLCTNTLPRFDPDTREPDKYVSSAEKRPVMMDPLYDEMEILLPRNSSYRVDSIEEQNGMKVINMTLVKI